MDIKKFKSFLNRNDSKILTGLSIIGLGTTVYNAIQDSYKVDAAFDEAYLDHKGPRNKKEEILLTIKCYIPTIVSGVLTAGCTIGINTCAEKHVEAATSLYLSSQAILQEYQRKVIEQIGINKERSLREEVVKEVAHKQPEILYSDGGLDDKIIETGHGNTLFYDSVAKVYFKSDLNYLKAQRNDMNFEVMSEMYFDWNEIMYRWGLPAMRFGEDRIFTNEHPFDPAFVPEIMENGQTRIIISYDLIPRSAYFAR